MHDEPQNNLPSLLENIEAETQALGFAMASGRKTGALLRTLAATKPGGSVLELGTGTGLATCWLLDGMDEAASLITVDNDESVVAVARKHLGEDPRILFYVADGEEIVGRLAGRQFDLIFADTWPGKFSHCAETLALLRPGGLYVIDDLLPQDNWPEDHAPKVPVLIEMLEKRPDLIVTRLDWSSGLCLAVKKATSGGS